MKRATKAKQTVYRLHCKFHPAGKSKSGKEYNEFVSFKVEDGTKQHDFFFLKDDDECADLKSEIMELVKSRGDVTVDIVFGKFYRFDPDNEHKYTRCIGGNIQDEPILYIDSEDDLPV